MNDSDVSSVVSADVLAARERSRVRMLVRSGRRSEGSVAYENALISWTGPFWSGEKVCEQLGLPSVQVLASLCSDGSIFGLETFDGKMVFPVWQFEKYNRTVTVRPVISQVVNILGSHDRWTVAVVLNVPAPELEGLSPLDWVRQDRSEEVLLSFARRVDREWSG